ncbi:ketoacyl-ACP synthase III family protein [Micromonospora auratinigra]|uniref:3-oxoacyl-[acyl-carrier-protein] synthase-3 n=1 Tax=Micromonospora auratinigra TaxID=261654 RepID=A0A1A8ZFG0_9ACTN|nr:ketoacyl-ACP synthase III family protein [Micromonospora auratinigra]SBT42745.1 3-oxoacyl-[acyl-carrier-protein] synthase-3 [Micromonospora auratinigra]
MRVTDIYLTGLGVHLPEVVEMTTAVEQGWFDATQAEQTGLTGAAVAGEVSGPEMALDATRQALTRAGQDPAGVDLLLYVDVYHSGPDGWLPQSYLQKHLLGGDLTAVGVRQGCNGIFGALELAASHLMADPGRGPALVVAADNLSSPLLNRWQALPGVVMGDAASAVVLSREEGFARLRSICSTTITELEGLHRGDEPLYPASTPAGRPLNFITRFVQFNQAGGMGPDGALLFVKTMDEVVGRALDEAGIDAGRIARVAFNNGARASVEDRVVPLGFTMEQSTWEYGRRLGHLGASDQLVSMDHLLDTGELGPGDHLLLLGLGPGVSIAAAVVEILAVPPWLA